MRLLLIALAVFLTPAAGHAGQKCKQAPPRTSAEFLTPGPYAVGQTTFTFVDTSRPTAASGTCAELPARTLVTEVWFPATSPGGALLDASGAPYPLVVHSHGLSDLRTGEEYLAEHLASWGYVVASADFPLTNLGNLACVRLADIEHQPGDVSFVIDSVLAEFGDAVDAGRIGASGLSYGGMTTMLAAYHREVRDARIKAAFPIAPALACVFTPRFFAGTDVPLLMIVGDSDQLVPHRQNAKRPYKMARAPKTLVTVLEASHTGFTGFLSNHPGTPHPDEIGCGFLLDILSDDPDANFFAGLEGKGTGVAFTEKRCPLPCEDTLPESALPAAVQQDLTRIAGLAFFEGVLRDDVGARCFLHDGFAAEHDEVRVQGRP
jgi:dienelactone hydrolase